MSASQPEATLQSPHPRLVVPSVLLSPAGSLETDFEDRPSSPLSRSSRGPGAAPPSGNRVSRFHSLGELPRPDTGSSLYLHDDDEPPTASKFLFRCRYLGPIKVLPECAQNRDLRDQAICRCKALATAVELPTEAESLSTPPLVANAISNGPSVELWNEERSIRLTSIEKSEIPICGRGVTHTNCFAFIERTHEAEFVLHAFECGTTDQVRSLAGTLALASC